MLLLETDTNVHNARRRTSGNVLGVKYRPVRAARVDPRLATSSTRLRSNLLRKLGIPPSSASLSNPSGQASPRVISLLGNAKLQRIPLNTDEIDQPIVPNKNPSRPSCHTDKVFQAWGSLWTKQQEQPETTAMSLEQQEEQRHVRFNQDVQVALIPTRHEYSRRIRRFLWDSPQEMREQIVRNTLEFTADGWDWQTVLEEQEHYFNPHNGQYIHPVHLEIAQMPPEEQEVIVPANYVNPALLREDTTTATVPQS